MKEGQNSCFFDAVLSFYNVIGNYLCVVKSQQEFPKKALRYFLKYYIIYLMCSDKF